MNKPILLILAICVVLSGCTKNGGKINSIEKPVFNSEITKAKETKILPSEINDGIIYIPSFIAVNNPQIQGSSKKDPAIKYETYEKDFEIGKKITQGPCTTYRKTLLKQFNDQDIDIEQNSILNLIEEIPEMINGEYYILCQTNDHKYKGYVRLSDIYYTEAIVDNIIIGYIPRCEKFITYNKATTYTNNEESVIYLQEYTTIMYNNLYIETQDKKYVIDGGSFDNYDSAFIDNTIIPFGLNNCYIQDLNNDGKQEICIEYRSIGSLSYYGLSTGPRMMFLNSIGNGLVPIFSYSKIGGEDIGAYYGYPFFVDSDNDNVKEVIELLAIYESDSNFSINKTNYTFNGSQYLEDTYQELSTQTYPFTISITKEMDIYENPSKESRIINKLQPNSNISIKQIELVQKETINASELWFKIFDNPGWIMFTVEMYLEV